VVKLTVLYEHPSDTEAFDAYYLGTHVPLAEKLPGIERVEVVRYGPGPDGTPPPYHLIAGLYFSDAEAMGAALGSPEGKALGEDVVNFPPVKSSALFGETA
jgi:uncharacterized protein (TIGR02118 family)